MVRVLRCAGDAGLVFVAADVDAEGDAVLVCGAGDSVGVAGGAGVAVGISGDGGGAVGVACVAGGAAAAVSSGAVMAGSSGRSGSDAGSIMSVELGGSGMLYSSTCSLSLLHSICICGRFCVLWVRSEAV